MATKLKNMTVGQLVKYSLVANGIVIGVVVLILVIAMLAGCQ